jgi:actin-related protein
LPDGTDGDWDTCNPIDPVSGLFHDTSVIGNGNKTTPDWCDLVHKFIQHAYERSLSDEKTSEHPILMAERSYNSPATRQMLIECLFEDLQVPAAFLAKDAVLSCYGCGRTSATVVDLGYSGATVTPVYEGYVDPKSVRRNPGAGVQATDELILHHLDKLYHKKKKQKNTYTVMPLYQVLRKNHKLRKPSIHLAARLFMAQECREEGAGATINTSAQGGVPSNFHAPSKPFELPDGTAIDVPSADRFRAADVMFGSDSGSQQLRDAKFAEASAKLRDFIDLSSSIEVADEVDTKQLAKEAVGILTSGRNGNRSRRAQEASSEATAATSLIKPRRSAAAWQRACLPHLQTLLDDQLTASPIAAMVCDAAYRCDRDQQAVLLGNVIVSGGGSCLGPTEQAVPDYVRDSIEALIHQHTPGWRVKVLAPTMNERAVLPWLGGSILGSLGTFHEMYITKAEYEEWGAAIVNRKCP